VKRENCNTKKKESYGSLEEVCDELPDLRVCDRKGKNLPKKSKGWKKKTDSLGALGRAASGNERPKKEGGS